MVSRVVAVIDKGDGGALRPNDLAKKTTVLEAMHLLEKAWSMVSESTICNCFGKAGFIDNQNGDTQSVFVNVKGKASTTQESLTDEQFAEWMSTDEHIQTCEELTEEALCSR
ncbi:hypothetical protein QAD02_003175 [Eretmocerus hayati]|uniref:Uncharacterized protein n=1 Tax=Eretmocerus hayati TaxID=131215 RepID=A0ACC2NLD1_9HYME|nr:hypothetical protein QAD02_003175 [Eretmocerus hayati]